MAELQEACLQGPEYQPSGASMVNTRHQVAGLQEAGLQEGGQQVAGHQEVGHQEAGLHLAGDKAAEQQVTKGLFQVSSTPGVWGLEEGQQAATVDPLSLDENKITKESEEMFLADEARWENMKTELKTTNNELDTKLIELNEKYQRLLKAKEASDVRAIELHDKNAELVTRNTSSMTEIKNLEMELKKEKDKNRSMEPKEVVGSTLNDLSVLISQKVKVTQEQVQPAIHKKHCRRNTPLQGMQNCLW